MHAFGALPTTRRPSRGAAGRPDQIMFSPPEVNAAQPESGGVRVPVQRRQVVNFTAALEAKVGGNGRATGAAAGTAPPVHEMASGWPRGRGAWSLDFTKYGHVPLAGHVADAARSAASRALEFHVKEDKGRPQAAVEALAPPYVESLPQKTVLPPRGAGDAALTCQGLCGGAKHFARRGHRQGVRPRGEARSTCRAPLRSSTP